MTDILMGAFIVWFIASLMCVFVFFFITAIAVVDHDRDFAMTGVKVLAGTFIWPYYLYLYATRLGNLLWERE